MKITIFAIILAFCILSLKTGQIEAKGGRGGSSGRGSTGRGSTGRGSTGRGSTGRGSTGSGSNTFFDGGDFISSGNSTVNGDIGGIIVGVTAAVFILALIIILGGIYCNKHWDSITYKVKRDLKHTFRSCSCVVNKNKDTSQNEDAPPSYGKYDV